MQATQSNAVGTVARWLQFTGDPRLPDPLTFDSSDLLNLLQSHVGKFYGYREDSFFVGGGFQHFGTAQLLSAATVSAVPEPSSLALGLIALAIVGLRRRVAT